MLTRRQFIATAAALGVLPPAAVRAALASNPFTLGVASGSPRDTSVVLWTRLAPEPLNGGGMPPGDVPVRYQVWADAEARRPVREGEALALARWGHSVHLKLEGLEPGREYFYRFAVGGFETPLARTRTTSRDDRAIKLAIASCQHYETNHYAAFRDMASWTPDCVVHVGDYIYEGAPSPLGARTREMFGRTVDFSVVRQHVGPETVTLWDYRNRYALYRTDPHLQAAHAAAPWVVAMDDHEIDNNWAADVPQDPEKQTPLEFRVRRLAALQAYYEHFPLEHPPLALGTDSSLQMYGRWRFGPALLHLLDTRQFRSDQVCGDGFPGAPACAAMEDPARSLLGPAQEAWLAESLTRSDAAYNVIASQVWFSPLRYNAPPAAPELNMDSWDGYGPARRRLLDVLGRGVAEPVFISGDWHCAAAMTVHEDPLDATTRTLAHEFAGTSIATPCPWAHRVTEARSHNPHVRYVNGDRRGYARFVVEPRQFTAQFRVVEAPQDPASRVATDLEIRTRDF
ncbi:MAG: alkaline phosphatase D family protein [Steroidobacteraceae bacterium]|nr:alkaline phosphatase D family protein [Steroidobacteraceae bacterium]